MADTARDPLEHFACELLRAAGLDAMPADAKLEFVRALRDQAHRRIGALALGQLDPPSLTAFQEMVAQRPAPAPAAVESFFTERIPKFEERVRDGLLQFADEFLSSVTRSRSAAAT